MGIITLTTDLGLNDHYVASLKGTILRSVTSPNIIDITHDVRPFDVSQAAFQLRSCYKDFPDGTIHVIGVDSEPVINFGDGDGSLPSIMVFENQYFISNDNGFFGVFLQTNKPSSFWRIDDVLSNPSFFKSCTKNMLIPTAIKLLNGVSIEEISSLHNTYRNALSSVAISEPNLIRGHVIYCDSFGNAITNINKELFDRNGANTPFTIRFKRKDYYIDVISPSYNVVPAGEKVALFNESNLLEIAINRGATKTTGGAAQLFGLIEGDVIMVEFTPKGSKNTLNELFPDF